MWNSILGVQARKPIYDEDGNEIIRVVGKKPPKFVTLTDEEIARLIANLRAEIVRPPAMPQVPDNPAEPPPVKAPPADGPDDPAGVDNCFTLNQKVKYWRSRVDFWKRQVSGCREPLCRQEERSAYQLALQASRLDCQARYIDCVNAGCECVTCE